MEREIRWTFRYNGNHLEDERYMQEMCRQGWAARSLILILLAAIYAGIVTYCGLSYRSLIRKLSSHTMQDGE